MQVPALPGVGIAGTGVSLGGVHTPINSDPTLSDQVSLPATEAPEECVAALQHDCFDYAQLDHEVAAEARETAARIRTRLKTAYVDTGRDFDPHEKNGSGTASSALGSGPSSI